MKINLAGISLLVLLNACSMGPAQEGRMDKSENEGVLYQERKPQELKDKTPVERKVDKQTLTKKKDKAATGEVLFCGKNDRKISLSFSKDQETAFIYFFENGKRVELSNNHVGSGMEYERGSWLLRGKDHHTVLFQYGTKMMCKNKPRKAGGH